MPESLGWHVLGEGWLSPPLPSDDHSLSGEQPAQGGACAVYPPQPDVLAVRSHSDCVGVSLDSPREVTFSVPSKKSPPF